MSSPYIDLVCAVCASNIPKGEKHRHIQLYCVCEECSSTTIKDLLEKALKYEAYFPPKFNPYIINYRDFSDLLTPDYSHKYRLALWERSTNPFQRVYCGHKTDGSMEACDTFLGAICSPNCGSDQARAYSCHKCKLFTCNFCVQPFKDFQQFQEHTCGPRPVAHKYNIEESDTCRRGIDFQYCSNLECSQVMYLSGGCNHVTCTACQKHYCYICNKGWDAGFDQSHWGPGISQCPTAGQPNMYNRPTRSDQLNQHKPPLPKKAKELLTDVELFFERIQARSKAIGSSSRQ